MAPQKIYSLSEMETMKAGLSSEHILRKFLSPGIIFEASFHVPRQIGRILTIRHRLTIEQDKVQANTHNSFADHQPLYGIPVNQRLSLWPEPEDRLWLPEVVQHAVVNYFYTRKGIEEPIVGRSPQEQAKDPFKLMPCIAVSGDEREPIREGYNIEISLPEMEEIGIDVESISETIGDVLAMFVFKCGFWYFGEFSFGTFGKNACESIGPATIGLCFSDPPAVQERQRIDSDRVREDATLMAALLQRQLPSPHRSPYLWDIFKKAFITRGAKYCSSVSTTSPEEVMKYLEETMKEIYVSG